MEVIAYDNANKVIKEIFESLLSRYQIGLEQSMKQTDFNFDLVQLLYYKCQKINFKRGRSSVESPDWNKKQQTNNKSKN